MRCTECGSLLLDECGMDINMTAPGTKETVLHYFIACRPKSKRNAVGLLKYLVEEKGSDRTLKTADGVDAWE